jgi:Txe/YoeB family toxin of toxin-antitoxin system
MWKLLFTKIATDDLKKIESIGLKNKVIKLLDILKNDPFTSPPSFERLKGDLTGLCSRRINIKHRLIYQIYEKEKVVKIIRAWTHYE